MKTLKTILLVFVVIVLCTFYVIALKEVKRFRDRNTQTIENITSIRDSLQQVVTANIIELNNTKEIIKFINSDTAYKKRIEALLKDLKAENKQYSSIITFQSKMIAEYLDSNRNIIINNKIVDTTIYPTYKRTILDEFGGWITGNIVLGLDTFYFNPTVKQNYNVTFGKLKGQTYADVQSLNPYTKTQDLRVFAKPDRKWFIGIGAGIAYLPIQNKIGLGIMFGINYKLW